MQMLRLTVLVVALGMQISMQPSPARPQIRATRNILVGVFEHYCFLFHPLSRCSEAAAMIKDLQAPMALQRLAMRTQPESL
jgi:hypothetical protein